MSLQSLLAENLKVWLELSSSVPRNVPEKQRLLLFKSFLQTHRPEGRAGGGAGALAQSRRGGGRSPCPPRLPSGSGSQNWKGPKKQLVQPLPRKSICKRCFKTKSS